MGISYYDALLPVREPGAGLRAVLARIRLPYRVLASVCVPGGRVVLVNDNWRSRRNDRTIGDRIDVAYRSVRCAVATIQIYTVDPCDSA